MKINQLARKRILIILVIAYTVSTIIFINFSFITRNDDKDIKNFEMSKISGPIHIIGNSGWADFKDDGNCTGSGNYTDPYVIKDLIINGEGLGSCIWIENSNVNFRIENCTAYNAGDNYPFSGIQLENVTNGQLIDNNCSSNYCGIIWGTGNNNTILGNTVNNNEEGLNLINLYDCTVSGNTANYNNYYGIRLGDVHNSNISGNTAYDNYEAGIYLNSCNNNNVYGNTINSNIVGILLESDDLLTCNYNNIYNNTANFNGIGIYLKGYVGECYFNNISGNNVSNNINNGISLYFCENNTVVGNTANANLNNGIYLIGSHNNTISGNTAKYNENGIYLEISNFNSITGNTLTGNDKCIKEVECEGNVFSDNGSCTYNGSSKEPSVPGYSLIFLICALSATLIVMVRIRKIVIMQDF